VVRFYQAGTLSGNPVALAAGLATLKILQKPGTYEELERKTLRLAEGLQAIAEELGLPTWVNAVGAMFSAFFTGLPVKDYPSACTSDAELFASSLEELRNMVYILAPSI
jgi:glutamate-1-semialdehyde 2,1-aminomutase